MLNCSKASDTYAEGDLQKAGLTYGIESKNLGYSNQSCQSNGSCNFKVNLTSLLFIYPSSYFKDTETMSKETHLPEHSTK